jgi:general secretion pathway protein B
MDSTPVYAPEIPVDETDASTVGKAPAVSARPREHTDQAPDRDAQNDEVLPEISELNLTADQALPDLHLDVHVYATNPADRFVYINMRKYREGAELQDGLTLERIRRDGVVLNYRGLRFLLPRQ